MCFANLEVKRANVTQFCNNTGWHQVLSRSEYVHYFIHLLFIDIFEHLQRVATTQYVGKKEQTNQAKSLLSQILRASSESQTINELKNKHISVIGSKAAK